MSVGGGQEGGPRSIGYLIPPETNQYYPRKTKIKGVLERSPGNEGSHRSQTQIDLLLLSAGSLEGFGGEALGLSQLIWTHQTGSQLVSGYNSPTENTNISIEKRLEGKTTK